MPQLSPNGKYILSAGEIASYTVCPEAWRLVSVVKIRPVGAKESEELGQELHQEWAALYDQSVFLKRGARLILILTMLALGAFLIIEQFRGF